MTDQDKILLMSYLDNELSANEISQVEALISTDTDAQASVSVEINASTCEISLALNSLSK